MRKASLLREVAFAKQMTEGVILHKLLRIKLPQSALRAASSLGEGAFS